jgi:endoglucanase
MRLKISTILLFLSLTALGQQQIPLNATDAYANQHKKDNFGKLSDGDITTHYTVWSPQITPYRVTYDLSNYDNCVIKQLRFFVNNGNPSNLKYIIRTLAGEEIILYSYPGGNWTPSYQTVNLNNTTAAKDFIIESNGGGDFPDEIQIYGSYSLHSWLKTVRQASPLSDLFGVVVKPWDIAQQLWPEKIPVLQSLLPSRVRLYNDYQFTHNSDGSWNMNQTTGWAQVDNMKLLKSKGINTQMCYLAFPYYPFSGDRSDPGTYIQLARDIYSFGVSNKASGEYFKTVEVGNEMDMWYNPDFAGYYMDGYQLAAMMSICYDGHKGLYPNVGLKTSGSQALVSMCGLAESEPYILYQVMEWSIKNRGYRADGTIDLPFDIYSFHCYSSLEGQREGIPGGVPPEYGMYPYFKRLNEIRNHYFPWLKIHLGEYGWDVSANSPLNAPAFGKYTADQTSAMWTVWAILMQAENGIDAGSYYRIKTDFDALDDGSYTQFATMALVRQESAGVKQADGSYLGINMHRTMTGDYYRQLSSILSAGYVFAGRLSTTPTVLKFVNGSKELYAIRQVEDMAITTRPIFTEATSTYSIPKSGTLRRFVDDGSGVMSSEPYNAGTQITANAKPVLIEVSPVNSPLPVHLIAFTAQKINQAVVIKYAVQDASKVEVERSTDGRTWINLGEGIFNNVIDRNPAPGRNYYRLKMYEQDGSFTDSFIRTLAITGVHARLYVHNIAGQTVKQGWSEDADRIKTELRTGKYYFEYILDGHTNYTEPFLKL